MQSTHYTIEDNFNEILSKSGILVLQKRFDYQCLPCDIFPPKLLQDMHRHMKQEFYHADLFNPQQLVQVKDILVKFVDNSIDEDTTRMRLLGLCENLNEDERAVIRAIVGLIPALYDCNMKSLSEAHLSASYIHPFMQGLFSSKQPARVAHCSNILADEQKTSNKCRPDYKVDIYEAYQYTYTNVYGEIKPTKDISPTLLINDFYRIAIFCKDALDSFKVEHSIGFQVAGSSLTWFVMTIQHDQFYTFTEVASLDIPMKKAELLNLIGRLDDLVLISKIHKTLCGPCINDHDNYRCPTLTQSYFDDRTVNKASKKRKSSLTLGN